MEVAYRKASQCQTDSCVEVGFHPASQCASGTCVEVAAAPTAVAVRDGKDRGGPVLTFTPHAWQNFIQGLK